MELIIFFILFGVVYTIYEEKMNAQKRNEGLRNFVDKSFKNVDLEEYFKFDDITPKIRWYEKDDFDHSDALIGLMTLIALEEGAISEKKMEIIQYNIDDMVQSMQKHGFDKMDILFTTLSLQSTVSHVKEDVSRLMPLENFKCFHHYMNDFMKICKNLFLEKDQDTRWKIIQLLVQIAYIEGNANSCQKELILLLVEDLGIEKMYIEQEFEDLEKEKRDQNDLNWAYETLGLTQNATPEEVRSRFRQLAKKYHPDIVARNGAKEEEIKSAQEKMGKINDAYEAIKRSFNV